ncbi:MAG: Lrp/AsnC family transcriptional regulator [Halobacteria archaeon]
MDVTNSRILEILKEDARTPYTEIADEIDASEGTVRNRISKMTENGTIRKFTVSTQAGNVRSMIEVEIDIDVETSKVSELITEWGEVDFVWEISGDGDLIIVVDAADTHEVNDVITRIRKLDETVSTRTRLILDEKI